MTKDMNETRGVHWMTMTTYIDVVEDGVLEAYHGETCSVGFLANNLHMACNEMRCSKTANKQAERVRTDGQQEEGSQSNMPHVVLTYTKHQHTYLCTIYTDTNYPLSVSGGQSHSAPRVELYVRVFFYL